MMAPNVFRVWSHLSLFSDILEVNLVIFRLGKGNLCDWTFHVRAKKYPTQILLVQVGHQVGPFFLPVKFHQNVTAPSSTL